MPEFEVGMSAFTETVMMANKNKHRAGIREADARMGFMGLGVGNCLGGFDGRERLEKEFAILLFAREDHHGHAL
jgi:hypothetical protein